MKKLGFIILWIVSTSPSQAMALRVEPVLVDVAAPAKAAQITLRNAQKSEMTVQMRIFRWHQENGVEMLDPTENVVASPPMTKLKPDMEYTARIIRLSAEPVKREESYRLIVDEVPDPSKRKNGVVAFTLRQSLPVFFLPETISKPKIEWSLKQQGRTLVLSGANSGEKRQRVTQLAIKDSTGKVLAVRDGLVGYVLARQTMQFHFPMTTDVKRGDPVELSANGEAEPIHATLVLDQAR